jgi:hypothetical protein
MRGKKRNVTLVGSTVAEVGYRFIYHEVEDCLKCRYKSVCTGKLYEGRVYEISSIMKTKQKIICPISEEEMVLVEVVLANILATVSNKKAVDEIITLWRPPQCDNEGCIYRSVCFPSGLVKGDKVRIKKVDKRISCPLNHSLRLVSLQPLL